MNNDADFIGSIPEHYDQGLGPFIFEYFADDLAQRVAASQQARVLEIAAGTGIATRRLARRAACRRDARRHRPQPADARGGAKEIPPGRGGRVASRRRSGPAVRRWQLRCRGLQVRSDVLPDRDKAYREAPPGARARPGATCSASGTRTSTIRSSASPRRLSTACLPTIHRNSTTSPLPCTGSIRSRRRCARRGSPASTSRC